MTSAQNPPTMHRFRGAGLSGVTTSRTPARTPHEITEADRTGTGRVIGGIERRICRGPYDRGRGADDRRVFRVWTATEERRRYGRGGPQRLRRRARQETGTRHRG